jgi:CHAT domain-containing protein
VRHSRATVAAHLGGDPAEVEKLRRNLRSAHQDFTDLDGFLAQSYPQYRLLTSTEPIDVPLLDRHLGMSTGLIEYLAVDSALISLVRARGQVTLHQDGDLAEISTMDGELTRLCRNRSDARRAEDLSRALYDRLVAPIEAANRLDELTDLIVVPAPEVFGFPVEALASDDGYVFERLLVTYLPAASVAPFLAGRHDSYEPALVLADPDGTLRFARQEAHTIEALFQLTANGQPFVGAHATAAQLSTWAPSARLIHIAAHADFDPLAPAFSTLRLAPNGASSGAFEVSDVLDLRMESGLVVLSGCDTGQVSTDGANEMIGFIRAFMVIGATAVVASRWAVADAATSEYMRTFYKTLAADHHPALAMRQARQDQIHLNGYEHPGHWASFTCFGLPPAWSPAPQR